MRKLLLVIVFALGLLALPGASKAAPCWIGNAGGCMHWSDHDRSTPGVVGVHDNFQVNAGAWLQAASARGSHFNGVVGTVKIGQNTAAPMGNAACTNIPYNAYAFKITTCTAAYNTEYCGSAAPHQWAACANVYTANDPYGNPTNHIVWAVVRLKDPGQYDNGTRYTLPQAQRDSLWCHEVLGHSYGMGHNDTDPANADVSCLFRQVNNNPLLGGVAGQIHENHNHNDWTGDYAGIGSESMKAPKSISVVKLKSVKSPDGKPYYVVPRGFKAPLGFRSATSVGSEPLDARPAPFGACPGCPFAKLKPKDSCMKRGKMAPLARRNCGNGYPVLAGCAYGQGTWDYGPNASPRYRQGPC